jgi:ABC-2 type transport system permease protein
MPSLIRAEIRKLTSLRGPWLLLAAGPLLVIAGVSGLVVSDRNLAEPATRNAALAHVGLAALLTLVLGVLAVAGEYRYRTVTDTYLGCPRRGRVVAAKLAVYSVLGALAGLVTAATALATVAIWWSAKGVTFPLSTSDTWRTLGGGVAANIAFAAIGVGLGALIRNLVIAITVALLWIVLIEGILAQLLGSTLARWLPFAASAALDRSTMSGTAGLLSQWAGALVLLGYVAVFVGAAVVTTLNRDVT